MWESNMGWCLSHMPDQGRNLQPKYVPQPGTKPETFHFTDWSPINWATQVRVCLQSLRLVSSYICICHMCVFVCVYLFNLCYITGAFCSFTYGRKSEGQDTWFTTRYANDSPDSHICSMNLIIVLNYIKYFSVALQIFFGFFHILLRWFITVYWLLFCIIWKSFLQSDDYLQCFLKILKFKKIKNSAIITEMSALSTEFKFYV